MFTTPRRNCHQYANRAFSDDDNDDDHDDDNDELFLWYG